MPPDAIRKVRESHAYPTTKLALEFLTLTATRSGEVRGARWGEVDLEAATWTVTGRVLSDNTLSKLLRDLEIPAVVHGMRSSFRDWCADTGQPREVAEHALAHVVRGVEGAYQRSSMFDRRRELMLAWASYLST